MNIPIYATEATEPETQWHLYDATLRISFLLFVYITSYSHLDVITITSLWKYYLRWPYAYELF